MSSSSYVHVLGVGGVGRVRFDESGPIAIEAEPGTTRRVKASRAPAIVIASAVGLIAFLALMVLLAGLSLTGCASTKPEAQRLAHELRAQIDVNRAVSQPKEGVDPEKWGRGQDAAARAAASLEKEVQ